MRALARRLRDARSLRAFAFEVAIVVVGVMIALSAQELVDDWNWSRKVGALERRLQEAHAEEFQNLREFVTVAPCMQAQADGVRKALLLQRAQGPFMPLSTDASGSFVIRTPSRSYDMALWQAANSDGTAVHLADERRARLSDYYKGLAHFVSYQSKLVELVTRTRVLAQPVRMSDDARMAMLQELSMIDAQIDDGVNTARQQMAFITLLGHAPAAQVDMPGTEPFCRKRGLPLGDWRRGLAIGMQQIGTYETAVRMQASGDRVHDGRGDPARRP